MARWNSPVRKPAVGEQQREVQVRRLGAVEGFELGDGFGIWNDL